MTPRKNADIRSAFSASVTPAMKNGATTTVRMSSVITVAAAPGRPLRRTIQSKTGHVVAARIAAHTIADRNGCSTRYTPPTSTASTTSVMIRSIRDGVDNFMALSGRRADRRATDRAVPL